MSFPQHARVRRARPSRAGFSLTDLIVAMILVSVIATVAIPSFFERSEVTLENAAILLARDLRAAQNRAAYLVRDVHVGFDESGDGYWIDDTEGAETPDPERAYLHRRYSENAVFEGVRITEVALPAGRHLTFAARGVATTGARITLHFDDDSRTVSVAPTTGFLDIIGSTSGYSDNGY